MPTVVVFRGSVYDAVLVGRLSATEALGAMRICRLLTGPRILVAAMMRKLRLGHAPQPVGMCEYSSLVGAGLR